MQIIMQFSTATSVKFAVFYHVSRLSRILSRLSVAFQSPLRNLFSPSLPLLPFNSCAHLFRRIRGFAVSYGFFREPRTHILPLLPTRLYYILRI